MKYLNLSGLFNPYNAPTRTQIQYEYFTFKGGEPHIKLDPFSLGNDDEVTISHRIETYSDMGKLKIAVDALRRVNPRYKLSLFLPYFPGARQDRVMVHGEPFTSAVYVKELDSLGFETITSYDVHSDVIGGMFAVLNTKFISLSNHSYVLEVLKDLYPQRYATMPILISPDAGSNKKIGKLAKYLSSYNVLDVVKCDKTRDIKTGEITDFEVYADDLGGKDCIIVDDICDGGGTFLGLVGKLNEKNAGNVYLVVSHGIFSHGLQILSTHFDGIYTTDSVNYLKYVEGIVPSNLHTIQLKPNLIL